MGRAHRPCNAQTDDIDRGRLAKGLSAGHYVVGRQGRHSGVVVGELTWDVCGYVGVWDIARGGPRFGSVRFGSFRFM